MSVIYGGLLEIMQAKCFSADGSTGTTAGPSNDGGNPAYPRQAHSSGRTGMRDAPGMITYPTSSDSSISGAVNDMLKAAGGAGGVPSNWTKLTIIWRFWDYLIDADTGKVVDEVRWVAVVQFTKDSDGTIHKSTEPPQQVASHGGR